MLSVEGGRYCVEDVGLVFTIRMNEESLRNYEDGGWKWGKFLKAYIDNNIKGYFWILWANCQVVKSW